jgi:hypothetical protein
MNFPEEVRHDERLLPFAKLLFYELLVAADTKGWCEYNFMQLVRIMGTHKDTVMRSLDALVACKHIKIEQGEKWTKRFLIITK